MKWNCAAAWRGPGGRAAAGRTTSNFTCQTSTSPPLPFFPISVRLWMGATSCLFGTNRTFKWRQDGFFLPRRGSIPEPPKPAVLRWSASKAARPPPDRQINKPSHVRRQTGTVCLSVHNSISYSSKYCVCIGCGTGLPPLPLRGGPTWLTHLCSLAQVTSRWIKLSVIR